MALDAFKELTPVFYNQHSVKAFSRTVGFPLHWHERMEFIFLKDGSLDLQIGEETYVAHAGDVIILMPMILHSGTVGQNGVKYDTIMFEPASFINGIPNVKQYITALKKNRLLLPPVTSDEAIARAVGRIFRMQNDKSIAASLSISSEIYALFALLCEHFPVDASLSAQNAPTGFSKVITYIEEHYDQPLTSRSLCNTFGYSQSYFSRRFVAETGLTPTLFIRNTRLEHATELLSETQLSICEVAISCGFSDTKYFSRCFHELYGMTPKNFRHAKALNAEVE